MTISVACPACRRPLQFPDGAGGRVAACPCGQQMMLPIAPVAAAPPPPARTQAPPRPRPVPVPARRPGGGSGAGPIVLVILLVLGLISGVVFFKRAEALKQAAELDAKAAARKAEEKREAEEESRYVLLRSTFDDELLPPDKRNVAEGPAQYLGMRVEVTNHGYDAVSVDPVYFTLTVNGARYGRDTACAVKFEPMTLKAGEKVSVPLAFEVPNRLTPVVVDFKPATPAKCNVRYGDSR